MKTKGKKAVKKNASPTKRDKKTQPTDVMLVSEHVVDEIVVAAKEETPILKGSPAPEVPVQVERRTITNDERQRLISLSAYFRAQRVGFGTTNPVEDWLLAEREINAMIAGGASI